ncbi:hypothetical protein LIER_39300 [Lithospermum erythrorhizon]|uniref:ATPase AAA-type core domain-containing protein n=1 Tax=Lithospermum erythrorhizon TaxID=34254 RepID=A0AAV3QDL5_LITER
MKTSSKSIIVIEDIDCSINLTNRNDKKNYHVNVIPGIPNEGIEDMGNKITLSGLLNFSDGLWSCCRSERIFVFTTNHVEKIDPALLWSGRMDLHIHMSCCSFPALKSLLKNYIGFDDEGGLKSETLKELEELIGKANITPADVSEILMKNRRDNEKAVKELIRELKIRGEMIKCTKKDDVNMEYVEKDNEEKYVDGDAHEDDLGNK